MCWKLHIGPGVITTHYFRVSNVSHSFGYSPSNVTIVLIIESIFKLPLGVYVYRGAVLQERRIRQVGRRPMKSDIAQERGLEIAIGRMFEAEQVHRRWLSDT